MASVDKLTTDLESLQEKLQEFQDAIKTDLATENGMGLLQVKNHAMMQYSQLSLYYALLKVRLEEEKEADKQAKRDERNRKRMAKSTILSEIRDEYSERPEEVYTSGKTIDKETMREEREKTDYEESRFVRVVTSRKDKVRKRQRERDAMAADSIGKMDNFAGISDALGEFGGKRFVAAAPQQKLGGKIGGIFAHVDVAVRVGVLEG
ncbi:hypothetical protein DYB37_009772 [Aphanomyces astaci]|uniref:Sas10 C-terminal domain-containing protein n=1 Tax=Aphanomyces astaci TaxID=112090 RepID=A0A3R6Y523_APHAT|nr:hypothetical protein DYB37_009772 [Aphanomyces astaci]